MIIYNVTVKVENEVHAEWLSWMKETHIPDVMATGLFVDSKMMKVLVDDTDGMTYSVQYRVETWELLKEYQENHAPRLQKEHSDKYEGKFVAFRTLLEEV
ncbi:DUF4286 family protein [bacterium SCSIO 12741]|nr:DUF4286 family protein [bacterium SCSIO 12741]